MEDDFEDHRIAAEPPRVRHIKKRSLKNKSISITFDEKDLSNYVTGFHKRKKKRRKEALKQQEEALRRKRIEQRKKRKQEREYALFGGAPPPTADSTAEGSDENDEEDDDGEQVPSVSGTRTYDNGDLKVTVTTSEIISDEDDEVTVPSKKTGISAVEKHNIPVAKKRLMKRVARPKSRARSGKDKNGKKKKGKGR